MSHLAQLSRDYVRAFHSKDWEAIGSLLAADFALEDPAGRFEGRQTVLGYIEGIFRDAGTLTFVARNIIADEIAGISVIEFELSLGSTRLIGTDVIHWKDGLMQELRAYLHKC